MALTFTRTARNLGLISTIGFALLCAAYAVTLGVGLLSLQSPQQPIADPFFSALEIMILLMAPLMVGMICAVHAWAPPELKTLSLMSLVFMGLLAGLTSSVHFVILTVSRHAAFSELAWMPALLSFRWPSVAYALDILAWDVFFPVSVFFAAPVFSGSRLAKWIRALLIVSGALALAGLGGVFYGDMQLRNIGIMGYVGVFLIVAVLLAIQFHRTKPGTAG